MSHTHTQPHVLLVELYWTRDKDPRIPLGHASILAALKAHGGIEVASLVRPVNVEPLEVGALAVEILDLTRAWPADSTTLALGAYVWAEDTIQALLPRLRGLGFRGRIVLGGPQISYAEAGIASVYPDADAFIRGYGEEALGRLVTEPEDAAIPGVVRRGGVDRVSQAQVDLAALPSPWLTGIIPLKGQAFIRWETQRGCPFKCAFCQHREAGARLARTQLDPGRIRDEIDAFVAAGVGDIAVLDPIFNTTSDAVAVLERFHALGYAGHLSLQCRLEMLTPEFLAAAQALDVTLEFGLQTIHPAEMKAIQRNNHLPKVEAGLAEVRRLGIPHEVSLIFGLPEQTLASFKESVDFCLRRGVPVVKAFPLMLLRGTALERERARWGLVEEGGAMPAVVASHTFTRADWAEMEALSNALKATEGAHPGGVLGLESGVQGALPNPSRWRPAVRL